MTTLKMRYKSRIEINPEIYLVLYYGGYCCCRCCLGMVPRAQWLKKSDYFSLIGDKPWCRSRILAGLANLLLGELSKERYFESMLLHGMCVRRVL